MLRQLRLHPHSLNSLFILSDSQERRRKITQPLLVYTQSIKSSAEAQSPVILTKREGKEYIIEKMKTRKETSHLRSRSSLDSSSPLSCLQWYCPFFRCHDRYRLEIMLCWRQYSSFFFSTYFFILDLQVSFITKTLHILWVCVSNKNCCLSLRYMKEIHGLYLRKEIFSPTDMFHVPTTVVLMWSSGQKHHYHHSNSPSFQSQFIYLLALDVDREEDSPGLYTETIFQDTDMNDLRTTGRFNMYIKYIV